MSGNHEPGTPEAKIWEHYQERLRIWAPICTVEHDRINELEAFTHDKDSQWDPADRERLDKVLKRPRVSVNTMVHVIDALCGQEIAGRLQPQPYPRSPQVTDFTLRMKEGLRSLRDAVNAHHLESFALRQLFIGGYAAVSHRWDETPDDDETHYKVSPEEIWNTLWDPSAKMPNLVDRKGNMLGVWVGVGELGEEWGEVVEELIRRLARSDGGEYTKTAAAIGFDWNAIAAGNWYNRELRELPLVRYEWRQKTWEYVVGDPGLDQIEAALRAEASGQAPAGTVEQVVQQGTANPQELVLTKDGFTKFGDRMAALLDRRPQDGVDYSRQRRWKHMYAYIAGDTVLDWGVIPLGRLTLEFVTGIPWRRRGEPTVYRGLGDLMRDGQDLSNRVFSQMLLMAASAPKDPLFISKSLGAAVVADIENRYAEPSAVFKLDDNHIKQLGDLIKGPPTPQRLTNYEYLKPLYELAKEASLAPTGLNPVALGQVPDPRRAPAATVNALIAVANTAMGPFFDAIALYRKRAGQIGLVYIEVKYDEQTLADLIGPNAWRQNPDTGAWELALPPKAEWPSMRRIGMRVEEAPMGATSMLESWDAWHQHGDWAQMVEPGRAPLGKSILLPEDQVEMIPSNMIFPHIRERVLDRIRKDRLTEEQLMQQQAEAQAGAPPAEEETPIQ